jgi:hypothetical protein
MKAPQRLTTVPPTDRSSASGPLAAIRGQAAFVRALLDEVERAVPPQAEAVSAQLVEELARLGCSFLEAAQALRGELDQGGGEAHPHREGPDVARCA